jgi:peptidoglycan hydrolase-like protein with peptidoglycan-binding domain
MPKKYKTRVNEEFFDWLTGKQEDGEAKVKGGSQGITDSDLEDFYKTLQDFVAGGKSVPVEKYGSMKYSKMIENIQAALTFLGYPLPKFGVDGFFGSETANAIKKFNEDTQKEQGI